MRRAARALRSAGVRTEPRDLHGSRCDLLVVGAGIHGAAIAREAALRGMTVVLADARDVAAGTSSRSSRLVHGGLRYLRQGNFALVRDALAERERLLRLCPHLVRPVPMLLPSFVGDGTSPWLARLGTRLYGWLARGSTLPPARALTAAAAVAAFPGLRSRGLRSAVEFFDAATQDTRLTLANALGAAEAGARVVTHCAVVGGVGDRVRLLDRLGGAELELHARHVCNAAGPAVDAVRAAFGVDGRPLVRHSRGSHLVLAPRAGETALAAFLPDGRIQFVIPHPDGTLVGTTEVDDELRADETGPPAADLDYLLAALAHLLEPAPRRADARFAYAGWRALPCRSGPAGALDREGFVVRERWAGGDLHSVVGGKLTTHRSFAERAIARIAGGGEPSPTRVLPLPGGGGPRLVDDPLWWRHGSRASLVRARIAGDAAEGARLCPHRPFLIAEATAALQHDGAVTFADLVLRRLVHAQGPCLEPGCLQRTHAWFLAARRWPVDDDAAAAIAALRAEVAVLTGELASWRETEAR